MSEYFASLNILKLFRNMPGGISQGLIWGIMALGIYVTFRLLDVADLTVDGSFTTGGAVTVMLILAGWPAWAALLVAILVGMLAGFCTGMLHTKFGIPAILSGILTQFALYSINLHIMGMAANKAVSVDKYHLLISSRNIPLAILTSAIIAIALVSVFYWYFGTEQGSALRATGSNPAMSRALGINIDNMKVLGLSISNGVVALAGGLMSQYQGFADINMGRGAIVIGLAAVIIGEVLGNALLKKYINFYFSLSFTVIGGIIYYLVVVVSPRLWLRCSSRSPISAVSGSAPLPNSNRRGRRTMLDLFEISKTFNPGTINEKRALHKLSLHLDPGDFVTVIGGNGAGKSTMLNAIAGVWPIDDGRIVLDGNDVTALPEHKRAFLIGRVFQDPMMGTAPNMQLEENLALAKRRGQKRGLGWGVTKEERAEYRERLKTLGLGLEDRMTARVGLLSGGQRQAVTLLMASLQEPKLLLLDEHTAALDPATAAKVLDLSDQIVSEHNLTTLMITHNMTDAIQHGNRLIMMNEGQIILDIRGEEKKHLTRQELLDKFAALAGTPMETDSVLLS